jgi:hypothetical protein
MWTENSSLHTELMGRLLAGGDWLVRIGTLLLFCYESFTRLLRAAGLQAGLLRSRPRGMGSSMGAAMTCGDLFASSGGY